MGADDVFVLRPLTLDDAEELTTLLSSEEESNLACFQWRKRTCDTVESTQKEIKWALGSYVEARALVAAAGNRGSEAEEPAPVAGKQGDRVVGLVGLHTFRPRLKSCEVGYWLCSAAQGRGVMAETVRKYAAYAFGRYDIHRLEIKCLPANIASKAVARAAGFTYEGVERACELAVEGWPLFDDYEVWSLLEIDPIPFAALKPAPAGSPEEEAAPEASGGAKRRHSVIVSIVNWGRCLR